MTASRAIAAITWDPGQFAVIITDLHLPGADGFEVLKAACDANPSIYVVMITGYASIDSAVRAVREGAYDYLAKPFALGQLEVLLTRIRDRMALEQENRELSTYFLTSTFKLRTSVRRPAVSVNRSHHLV